MPALVIRVDADRSIGLGHLVRCLALSRAWPAQAALVMSAPHEYARRSGLPVERVQAAPGSADDARATAAIARARGAEWIVVDGYQFGADYHRVLRAAGLHTLCVDDNGEAGEYVADVVVNQNPHAGAELYTRRAPHSQLLLGTDYVMLRPEFDEAAREARPTPAIADRLLVTLGGGSAEKPLLTILDGLAAAPVEWAQVTVISGGVKTDALAAAALRVSGDVHLLERTDRMPDLMASVTLAMSAGGSTTWELAYMGVPAVLVVAAANQRAAAAASAQHGIAVLLGDLAALQPEAVSGCLGELAHDPARRGTMAAAGRALIDGRGAARVVAAMAARTTAAGGA